MANKIYIVEEVHDRISKSYPDGVDVTSRRQLELLMQRVFELEAALTPFAQIGARSGINEPELQQCYTRDCLHAHNMIDPTNSERKLPGVEIPAAYF